MFQYKLIHILNDNSKDKIKEKFKEEEIQFFTNEVVGIRYSVQKNTYSEVLRKVMDIEVKQYTFTSYKFKQLIKLVFEYNLFLGTIEFVDHLDEDVYIDLINNHIFNINNSGDKIERKSLISRFLKELEWVMLEDSIDIKNIRVRISMDDYPFESEIVFFNNGVIFIDSEKTLMYVKCLLEKII